MPAALEIARKDLRQRIRDRSALLVAIVAPFALAALFSMILGGVDQGFHGRWGYVDLDGGELAAALEAGPLQALADEGVIDLEELPSADVARAALQAGQIDTAIIVPAGFSSDYLAGRGGEVQLVVDADAGISAEVARSLLAGFADRADAVQLAVRTAIAAAGGLPSPELVATVTQEARSMPDPVTVADLDVADRQAGYTTYYAGAMAILFVFLTAQFGLTSIHAERRAGTMARILAAPVRWPSVLLGKLIVSLVLSLVSMTVIVLGTGLLLGATWGDPVGLAVLLLAGALSATGIALLAVAFTQTEEQAGAAVAIVTLSLAVLGGSFFPANQSSELLAQLSLVTPHGWFLRGVNDLATGGDVASAAAPALVLVVIGLVCGGLGLLRARRMVTG